MRRHWRRALFAITLLVVASLFAIAMRSGLATLPQLSRLFGIWLPLALLPGAGWHLLRTEAWRRCFPEGSRTRFGRAFRVRLAAEAVSYLTIAGVAGDPLKVVLMAPAVPAPVSAAATALERAAYLIVTAAVVSLAAITTILTAPLTARWTQVFAGIAVGGGVAVIVPLALLLWWRPSHDRPPDRQSRPAPTKIRRFLREFAAQFRMLATGDRRRLLVVVVLEAGAFLMMALEVFAALRLAGTPVTLQISAAIETFTRVASLVTAFVPGNLGALELSNFAAAAAFQAAGGGVALALLRRVRGLIWCAAGFMVYPRATRRDRAAVVSNPASPDPAATLVAVQRGDSDATVTEQLGGMPVGERIARVAVRAGYGRLLVWTPHREAEWLTAVRRVGGQLEIVATGDASLWREHWARTDPRAAVTVLAPGIVASPQLLLAPRHFVVDSDQAPVEVPAGAESAPSGVFRATVEQAADGDALAQALLAGPRPEPTRHDVSGWAGGAAGLTLNVATHDDLGRAEALLRASIFKPTDGRLGRFNRRLSIPISIALIRLMRLNAHAMSVVVIALGLYAGWLFSLGNYWAGVWAAVVSLAASILDGCDGELARLQYKESAFGCWVDTIGDYLYYVAIFAGLTIGSMKTTEWPLLWWCSAALCLGLLFTFALLILLRWRITDGEPERLRTRTKAHFYATGKPWARVVAKLSTCATRATMPYGIVVFALLGLLPVVVVLATIGAQIYWISLAREFRRLVLHRSVAGADLASSNESSSAPTPSTA